MSFQPAIDEHDERLVSLKEQLCIEVYASYQAVNTALVEITLFNVSGSYTVSELWNSKEKRKASTQETQWKLQGTRI